MWWVHKNAGKRAGPNESRKKLSFQAIICCLQEILNYSSLAYHLEIFFFFFSVCMFTGKCTGLLGKGKELVLNRGNKYFQF